MTYRSLEWVEDAQCLRLLDQRRLPARTCYVDLATETEVAAAIRDMTVRGAPAIGVAAAFGMVLAVRSWRGGACSLAEHLFAADALLRASRPTAVNLFWALDRMAPLIAAATEPDTVFAAMLAEAKRIEADDVTVNQAISRHAMAIVPAGTATFFHHCNTGALATVALGTALGIIRTAHESGRTVFAYLDETRPRLQGSKLSAWELRELGIPHAVVVDGASAHIMRTRPVDLCVVGCDRVAANGDTANKIGTYNLALAAQDNGVPFYVAAPGSTIDLATPDGDAIEIEERDAAEITQIDGITVAAAGIGVVNPAFDVTPARLIAGIITEFGIARPPFHETLPALLAQGMIRKTPR